ncbi:MAG: mechanosensitive ion channel [Rickettsiales bacterium]|nr:mechanosensitive ion channel [Rickettsiales bacterium]
MPIKQFLDSDVLSFSIGSFKFSIYSLSVSIVSLIVLIGVVLWILKFGEQKLRSITVIKASNKEILIKCFYIIIFTTAFFVMLGVFGIDLTAIAVLGGSIGIGIGFGLQKIAANFITGILLLFEKSFEVGDLIELNDKTLGFVRQINARFVLVETFCGKAIMVPNEEFMTNKIVNWTHQNAAARLEVKIQVSYVEDIKRVHKLIVDVAKNHSICLKDPEPFCLLQDVSEGLMFFSLRFWISDVRDGFLIPESKVRFAIWERLQKEGVKMPMAYRVFVKNSDLGQELSDEIDP